MRATVPPLRVCPARPAWHPQPGRRALGSTVFLAGFFFSVRLLTFDHDRCMSASSIFSDIDLARAICSSPSPAIAAKPSSLNSPSRARAAAIFFDIRLIARCCIVPW